MALSGGTAPAHFASHVRVEIPNYAGTTFYKNVTSWGAEVRVASTGQLIETLSGYWKSTSAITRLTFIAPTSFVNGSVFTLYGVGAP